MAEEYLKACQILKIDPTFVGRSLRGMEKFEAKTGIRPVPKLDQLAAKDFDGVIIAVDELSLSSALLDVLEHGYQRILVEKPGGSSLDDFPNLSRMVLAHSAEVYVAFNRRFYGTVAKLVETAKSDGGLVSIHFEFTERALQVETLKKDARVKDDWFFQNSSHVIDLVSYLAPGLTISSARVSGQLSWHRRGSTFSGFGCSNQGIHVTYNSVWGPSGGWEVCARTQSLRLELKPFEKLAITYADGSREEFAEENLAAYDGKPGLTMMLSTFLDGSDSESRLVPWSLHALNWPVYRTIIDGTHGDWGSNGNEMSKR